ncbi:hypothetical protein [Kiloniella sp. b19]|uniref:hypothetical protein n=1 Tax=Kiloniella sp. GXU_MW_B19 TaxID=3141326 RepID=UPI0031D3E6B2
MDNLSGCGFYSAGQGDDAVAMAHSGYDFVVRLAQNEKPFSDFVALCQREVSPHFPEFLAHETKGGFSVSIVEKLEPVSVEDTEFWDTVYHAASLAYAIADGRPCFGQNSPEALTLAAGKLGKAARHHYYALDLSVENIMRRKSSGEVVFNDPWSPWGES